MNRLSGRASLLLLVPFLVATRLFVSSRPKRRRLLPLRSTGLPAVAGTSLLLLSLSFFLVTPAHAQTALSLPGACAAVLESIVRDHVAPEQFAGLRNAGTILCFAELAPKEAVGKNETPGMLLPVSLASSARREARPSEAAVKVLGTKVNNLQERINQDVYHLQLSGADFESWRSCIKREFSEEQLRTSSSRASKFSKYWIQLAGIIFKSKPMNCRSDAPDTAIRELWPTKSQRESLKSKYKSSLTDVKTDENRLYWGLRLLDSIDEYRIALKLFDDEASHLAETARRTQSARLLPVSMPQPASCKISGPEPTTSASAMPATINLCKDAQAQTSTSMQFDIVDVYEHNSGKHVDGQPSTLKPTSFVLNLQTRGAYDINSTIIPASGGASVTTHFLFESCANPTLQLCAFTTVTSHGLAGSFELKVN
jgi:hypothetical protein